MLGFAVTGAVAIYGVFQLAKHHPQSNLDAPLTERLADPVRESGLD
jgi:hypothetical protein